MDAVESARREAARRHAEAVSAGADPWKPASIVSTVAAALRLDVEAVLPGSAVLDGGLAVFDPLGRAILHEHTGDDFHHAMLIGHEIGHAVCGDDQVADVVRRVDPARTAEAAPVGEERVVDYSRRQRREVQMDLFGRELIMPRAWIRTQHLDGMTATAVADRLGAPFDAVAQQLLDALLLPAAEEAGPAPDRPLNREQRKAAEHVGGPYLLEAGPGTGKTQTLVGRACFLVDQARVDPRRILVLTFSNKAAGELAERIAARGPDSMAMPVGTFHAFGLDLVRRFHRELGFPREPRMMDRPEAVELLEAEFTRLGLAHYRDLWDPSRLLRDLLGAISRAKDEVADASRYAELAEAMRLAAASEQAGVAAAKAAEVAGVYARYEDLKRDAVAVDFGDLVALPVRLLSEHPAIADKLRGDYDHVLVDEYQDVNRASVRLLRLLTDGGRGLWAVGDARQSIYRFRGASSFNMARFAGVDFPGAVTGRLKVNYRSVEEIVDAYSTFGEAMGAGNGEATLKADRGRSGFGPEHVVLPTGDEEACGLAEGILAQRAAGHPWRSQAVLCKGNERLAKLGAALESLGIPVLFLGSLFERPEVRDLLSWLSLLVDRRAMGLVRRKAPADLNPSLPDVAAILRHLRPGEAAPLSWLDAPVAGLTVPGAAAVRAIGRVVEGFNHDDAPWPVLARLMLDRTRLAADVARGDDVATRARGLAIWQFMNFVRVQPAGPGLPITRLLDRIRRLVLLADERDLRQLPLAGQQIDAVRLLTIHGSKGLEFPVVHLPGLNKGAFPRSPPTHPCPPPDGMIEGAEWSGAAAIASGEGDEQECLFYVALSRARDRLFLYSAAKTTSQARRDPSPYLAGLGGGVVQRTLTPTLTSTPDEDSTPFAFRPSGTPTFSEHQLDLYERCPRRFLYTHLIEVGGRRTDTAFMQMHEVVRDVVVALAAMPPDAADPGVVAGVFAAAFDAHALASHGYAGEFRTIALGLVDYFVETRTGRRLARSETLTLAVPGGTIIVTPDEVLDGPDGSRTFRRLRTGHESSRAKEGLATAAFHLAATDAFPGCRVELVHLADRSAATVQMKPAIAERRRGKVAAVLAAISAGSFPTKESPFTCPRCPAFFICGPVVEGPVEKKF